MQMSVDSGILLSELAMCDWIRTDKWTLVVCKKLNLYDIRKMAN